MNDDTAFIGQTIGDWIEVCPGSLIDNGVEG